MTYTDDSVLSLAVAKWLADDPTHDKQTLIDLFKYFGRRYMPYSFEKDFRAWVRSDSREPYGANTNCSAMRVAPVAWYAQSLDECLALAKTTAEVTHNSDEGIRGAQAIPSPSSFLLPMNPNFPMNPKPFLKKKPPDFLLRRDGRSPGDNRHQASHYPNK